MPSSYELLRASERLSVAQRFLTLRPRIVLVGAACNGACLALSGASAAQRLAVVAVFGLAVSSFFAEAWWLGRHRLTERWLWASLALTLLGLATGALVSGGIASPFLPLFFAPAVVGLAAFGRSRQSFGLLAVAAGLVLVVTSVGPLPGLPLIEPPWGAAMLAISTCVSLALLGVGVIGLVDAYAGVAAELERMREDALAEADQRAATVEQLGAHVAHELKNPLTAVRGLVQLVARKTDDRKQAERLAVVEAEVDRVLDALRGYLSFTKPVTELRRQDVDVRSLLEEVSALVEARAASRGVVVSVRGESVVEKLDPRRMRDAVLNLALNAMDAMPGGGHLELEIERLDGGLRLVVRDDGVGVAKDLAGRLGEPYASRSEGGTGLGVLIATGIVRQHGGALSFESSEQAGTRVTIELPAAVEGRT